MKNSIRIFAFCALVFSTGLYSQPGIQFDTLFSVFGSGDSWIRDWERLANYFQSSLLRVNYDPKLEKMHGDLEKSLSNFQFRKLYESEVLKPSEKDLGKWVGYLGKYKEPAFYVTARKNEVWKTDDLPNFGDYSSHYSIRDLSQKPHPSFPSESLERFALGFRSQTNFQNYGPDQLIGFLDLGLGLLESKNVAMFSPPPSQAYPGLKGEYNRKILSEFAFRFPKLFPVLESLFRLDQLQIGEERGIQQVHFRGTVKEEQMKKSFPHLNHFLDQLRSLGYIHIQIKSDQGVNLGEISLISEGLRLEGKFFHKEGKIVPYSEFRFSGTAPEKSFRFQDLKEFSFPIDVQFSGTIFGLKFENHQIKSQGIWNRNPNGLEIRVQTKEIGRTKVTGGFASVIPHWLIDFVIPGNMEDLAFQFSETIRCANDGKGSFLRLNGERKNKWYLNTEISTEMPDSFLIRFAMRVMYWKIFPRERARKELLFLIANLIQLGTEDLKDQVSSNSLRAKGLEPSPEAWKAAVLPLHHTRRKL